MTEKPTYEELEKKIHELEQVESVSKKAEDELQMSEEKFRVLFEKSIHGILIVDIETRRLPYANSAFCRMFGYSESEMLQIGVEDIHPKDSLDYILSEFSRQKQGEKAGATELPCIHKDGTVFNADIAATNIVINHRKCVVGFFIDITERKQAEKELLKSETFLNTIVENIPNMIFIKDAKDLRFVRFNKAGEDLLGYSREEMIGKNDYDFFSKEAAEIFIGKDREVLNKKAFFDIPEEPIQTKQGKRILHTKKISLLDKNGQPEYLLGISEDITERKLAEEELVKHRNHLEELVKERTHELEEEISERKRTEAKLRKSEERYREYFEENISGSYISSPEGQLIDCNKEYERIFGFNSTQEALETPIDKFSVNPNQRVEFLELLKKEKRVTGYKPIFKKIDGTPIHLIENASGVFNDNGNLKHIRGFLLDVTEQRKLEFQLQQSQKMESIGTLTGGIAHNFNNALYPIIGFTEMSMDDLPKIHPVQENLKDILDCAKRAGDMVKQILQFSRQKEQDLKPILLQSKACD